MDRDFTARFYKIETANEGRSHFGAAIAAVEQLDIGERRYTIANGPSLRLETVRRDRGLIVCDMSRVQAENKPGEFKPGGVVALNAAELSHAFAFAFDPETDVLALQYADFASQRMVLRYFTERAGMMPLGVWPVPTKALLSQLEDQTVTSLEIKMAPSSTLHSSTQGSTDIEVMIGDLSRQYEAPIVQVRLSVGGHAGGLNLAAIRRTVGSLLDGRPEVRDVSAKTRESETVLDFIKGHLKHQETLALEKPNQHDVEVRRARMAFVERAYDTHREYIRRYHSSQADGSAPMG